MSPNIPKVVPVPYNVLVTKRKIIAAVIIKCQKI
jgi:hypothetical protein